MAKLVILPLKVSVTVPEFPPDIFEFPPIDVQAVPNIVDTAPPTVTPPTPTPTPTPTLPPNTDTGVYAFPPVGLTPWSRDAGQRIADHLAQLMGIPRRPYQIAVVFAVQAQIEDAGGDTGQSSGALHNNPLNLSDAGGTITWPGQIGRYFDRFASFDTLDNGALACAMNYLNGAEYGEVRNAFQGNDPFLLASAIQNSPWDEGHYNYSLVSAVHSALGV